MISPLARLQVRLGIIDPYDPRTDFSPDLDHYPSAWDHIPVVQRAGIEWEPVGISWENKQPYVEKREKTETLLDKVQGRNNEQHE